jgi:deoxyribodipyrimidine photo-lyase
MQVSSGGNAPPQAPVLLWFRDDLRLADNPALSAAVATGRPVLAVYILDDETKGVRRLGGAARWWLHGSLEALGKALSAKGAALHILKGPAEELIQALAKQATVAGVYWNRRYDEAERALDGRIKEALKTAGIEAKSFNGHLLNEPWEVTGKSGGPMKVFTPYWRTARERGEPGPALPAPSAIAGAGWPTTVTLRAQTLDVLGLKPTKPDWSTEMATLWQPGEDGARETIHSFLTGPVKGYGDGRNRPDYRSTSRLSPHLRFGEISPRQVWHAAKLSFDAGEAGAKGYDLEKFLSEVGWREFAYHLLYQFPALPNRNFQPKFDGFPWLDDPAGLKAWQKGLTGYPIVDAGMRELWRTGWMHNRVRMITASFLVKHLLIDWRAGENWFWDTLLDADHANNSASWQWVAGSGADAAPYFRIFAPVLQGEKFDPNGEYVRQYIPELAKLPKKYIHKPWEAPHPILAQAGIKLGITYPRPIVAHEAARTRALAAFKSISAEAAA